MSFKFSTDQNVQYIPQILNPNKNSDYLRIKELLVDDFVLVSDPIESQVADLIKSENPSRTIPNQELMSLVQDFFEKTDKDKYGNWVFFPWKNTLVHILSEEEFIKIRTLRNNFKITPAEQKTLGKKIVGVVGLSVGQSIALAMTLERGYGEIRLADFDTLELSNLNRLKAGVTSLGLEKVILAAREIAEIDPYLNVKVYREGITAENVDEFILEGGKMDLLIDECDSLDIKVLLREKAKEHKLAVMMDTSDKGMLDVERFDLEPERELFHGLLQGVETDSLKNLSSTEKVSIVLKITGLETLSPRMKVSLLEIGQTITSWPQLASGVFLGGASVAHAARKFLLGDDIKSGRYYVDFDNLFKLSDSEEINIDSPVIPSLSEFQFILPSNVLQSAYQISRSELEILVDKANWAPSGGNIQPWIWVFDKKGVLHLFHDKIRSHSMLDYKGTGSLIAFGAALENLRLHSGKMGIEIEIIYQIKEFDSDCIASIRFLTKQPKPLKIKFSELADGIDLRCTNRKNKKRYLLSQDEINLLLEVSHENNVSLEWTEKEDDLEELAKIVGGMDRLRFFHDQGLVDFVNEVRWTEKEAIDKKDGIDIATLELSGTEKAAMGLLRDPRTIKFFRKYLMGYGLTKISKDTITSASGIFLLKTNDYSPISILNAGIVLQRLWIKANMLGLSVQPVSAMLFIFHRILNERETGFTEIEENEILNLKNSFTNIFNKGNEQKEIFMFRINKAGDPTVKSYRRDLSDTLIII
ncbi:Rv1355c family protein [Algoriphagus sp.]|uniref:Rv1355c family protein n=1 Tax=Algoriphagus sp. TaxID=1872435 RepID=UPI0025F72AF6|nr:Rv1355c family protein [Algoriphagus sp.]